MDYGTMSKDVNSPALGAMAIEPADTPLSRPIRAVTINGGGVIEFEGLDQTTYTTGHLPPGTYPLFARTIYAATTATDITGWF